MQNTTNLPLLAFDDVTFGYDPARPVVRDVSFGVARGAMVALLGPNGAGKTSLLRLANGVARPQQGHVWLAGRDVATLKRRAIAQTMAVVPQDLTMPFAYTARQMIEMGRTPHLAPLGWGALGSQDHQAVAEAIQAAEVGDLAERQFNELSGGERQRVLVAMALAQSPQILLLDEPTAHLDIRHQIAVLELVARLNHDAGITVLATLHDLNLAARYFPRLILFQHTIVADGPPSAALNPDLLARVYGIAVRVGILRGARHLSILPPGSEEIVPTDASELRAHVVAGGGTGDLVMRALAEAQIAFSAGALNVGDSDHALAEQLAARVIAEPPYAPVSESGQTATFLAMHDAGRVIICPIPLGPGNVALLRVAREALAAGARVWLFEPTLPDPGDLPLTDALAAHVAPRDYADGAGAVAYANLARAGALVATNLPDLLATLHSPTETSVPSGGMGSASSTDAGDASAVSLG
jgi:iron complex transport system ATP-binding protein